MKTNPEFQTLKIVKTMPKIMNQTSKVKLSIDLSQTPLLPVINSEGTDVQTRPASSGKQSTELSQKKDDNIVSIPPGTAVTTLVRRPLKLN